MFEYRRLSDAGLKHSTVGIMAVQTQWHTRRNGQGVAGMELQLSGQCFVPAVPHSIVGRALRREICRVHGKKGK